MPATLTSLAPAEVRARMTGRGAVLVDIREADEFARSHIAGAVSQPLSGWEQAHLAIDPAADVIFTCRSGMRTAGACDRLAARVTGEAFVLAGGLDGWRRAGFPVATDRSAPLEIMRQVQIAAGALILIGALLGTLVAPAWYGLSAFVGAGLLFAGLSGFCGMARLLMLAPWNRHRAA
ncbi:MAG: rhodanese family protein [Sphingopyxis sp.]|uniref:rhodanese family protein n=1 Tax=Sphingopyxis sp. TaxID=1908224 RepID=UPI001A5A11DE|nr:rhodanese family protein [Sphingopyxis sp.]MBL9068186.1 rhodanese family protein [Sphingopyxis sp.]